MSALTFELPIENAIRYNGQWITPEKYDELMNKKERFRKLGCIVKERI